MGRRVVAVVLAVFIVGSTGCAPAEPERLSPTARAIAYSDSVHRNMPVHRPPLGEWEIAAVTAPVDSDSVQWVPLWAPGAEAH